MPFLWHTVSECSCSFRGLRHFAISVGLKIKSFQEMCALRSKCGQLFCQEGIGLFSLDPCSRQPLATDSLQGFSTRPCLALSQCAEWMSFPSCQRHRTGYRQSPVRILPVRWRPCGVTWDLFPNGRGNKAAANLRLHFIPPSVRSGCTSRFGMGLGLAGMPPPRRAPRKLAACCRWSLAVTGRAELQKRLAPRKFMVVWPSRLENA